MSYKTTDELLAELLQIINELEWVIAMPNAEEDDEIPGMIIGTSAFVNEVISKYDSQLEVLDDTEISGKKREDLH